MNDGIVLCELGVVHWLVFVKLMIAPIIKIIDAVA